MIRHRHTMYTLRGSLPQAITPGSPLLPIRFAAFIKRHGRIAIALLGVEILSAIITSACGDTPSPPELSVTKAGVVSGQTVTYTITVTNTGSSTQSGVI